MSAATPGHIPDDPPMSQDEICAQAREMLSLACQNTQAIQGFGDFDEAGPRDGLDQLFARIDLAHPGLFEPEQDSDDGERLRQARSSDHKDQATITVSSFMSEITVGMGSFAHAHFDIDQADQALALIDALARGETGCLEARKRDGSIQWGRFIKATELDALGGPALSAFEHHASARFFGAQRDIDFFQG